MNPLARPVSCFHGVRPKTLYDKSLEEVCALIKSDTCRDAIQELRTLGETGEAALYKRKKEKLPSFTPCGTFAPTRGIKNLVEHNGVIQGDIDHLNDPAVLAEAKQKICADRYTLYCFVSPGGQGLKFGLHFSPVTSNDAYKHAWHAAAEYHLRQYDLHWDKAAKDLPHLCFMSWDPELYTNAQADLFPVPAYEPPKPSKPSVVPSAALPHERRAFHADLKIRTAIKMIAEARDGERHEARLRAGELLGGCVAGGILGSDQDAYDAVASTVEGNTDHRDQALKDLRQAIEHGHARPILLAEEEAKCQALRETHSRPKRQRKRKLAGAGDDLQDVADFDEIPGVDAEEPWEPDEAEVLAQQHADDVLAARGRRPQDTALPYSDYTNALALVRNHRKNLRYCYPWGKWLVWTGTHWQQDVNGAVMRLAKRTVKRLASRAVKMDKLQIDQLFKHIKASLATAKLKAMIECAQSEEGIPVQPEDLDRDQWLLNCPNGTLDLRTGSLRAHDRKDLITRCIETPYDPKADCSEWKAFLWKIMAQNQELIDFLQRLIGLSLTGDVSEQFLYIFWGSGANGKSTLVNTVLKLLGLYAMKANAELLMATKSDRHPTERADLFGKRCVATIETRESGRLNETFVKEATGGDPIRARRMREDFWEFDPTHKIILATNHKPQILGTDYAIWRRIHLVSFTVTIPEAQQDKKLVEKLNAEMPGILAWAVRGCLDWQQNGLRAPAEVTQETTAYRDDMDDVGQFLREMCTLQPYAKVRSSALHQAYLDWGGEAAPTQKSFTMRLTEHGYARMRGKTGQFWQGIGLSGMGPGVGPGNGDEDGAY
jgi:putative DNA primase/helicase